MTAEERLRDLANLLNESTIGATELLVTLDVSSYETRQTLFQALMAIAEGKW